MPCEVPPPRISTSVEAPRPAGAGAEPLLSLQNATPPQPPQPQQPPLRLPEADLFVEVVGQLPLRTKLGDLTRLLALRSKSKSLYRTYPPTIRELITLVERNPAKPVGREWLSIRALTIGYDHATNEVTVEYCVDYCETDPKTGAPHPKRKMRLYRAPEQLVLARLDRKLDDLRKYSAPKK